MRRTIEVLSLFVCLVACGGATGGAAGGPDAGPDAGSGAGPDAGPDAGVVLTIDATATAPASVLSVGTNQLYSVVGQTSPAPTAEQRLTALAPALVRLHVHAVGGNLPTAAQAVKLCPTPASTACNRVPWSFTNLDYLVNDVRSAGAVPLMNIALPPPWQYTVTDPNSTPHPTGHVTDESDPTAPFGAFASYMRSLVEYYNLGQTTVTEADGSQHTIVNPSGTSNRIVWWELLNEPAISSPANPYQPAGAYPLTPAFSSQAYIAMWNATAAAMRAADPGIKLVGPALPFVIGSGDYVPLLLQQAILPDAISFHGYAWADNACTDQQGFSGAPGNPSRKGLAGVLADLHQIQAWTAAAGHPTLPIWLDEFGLNGFGVTDLEGRPTHNYGTSYSAAAFSLFAHESALAQLDEFAFSLQSYPDLSLLNLSANRQPVLLYWLYRALGAAFPAGSVVLPLQSSAPFGVQSLGIAAVAMRATSGTVSVLISNTTPASTTDLTGAGVPATVRVSVNAGPWAHVSAISLDGSTNLDAGPAPAALPAQSSATVTLPGYGVALLQFAP